MAQVFFHCVSPRGELVNQSMAEVADLPEVREYAARLVQTLVSMPNLEDWRHWALYVSDELGQDLFTLPFAALLGKPH
ncbi:MAG TPA: hypothetical protein VNL39_15185 [Xanthobacteraceae bacterium]|nr:hypothetical protein [Xanthobacteraceae bacterium]